MAKRTLPMATLAATLALAACVSPYEDAIKTDLLACQSGNSTACQELHGLQTQDQIWHAQKNEEVGNALLGILAVGLTAGAIAAASHPAPPPPPVFIPAPPIPMVRP